MLQVGYTINLHTTIIPVYVSTGRYVAKLKQLDIQLCYFFIAKTAIACNVYNMIELCKI